MKFYFTEGDDDNEDGSQVGGGNTGGGGDNDPPETHVSVDDTDGPDTPLPNSSEQNYGLWITMIIGVTMIVIGLWKYLKK